MLFDDADLLHISEEINFECTGCGNCCLQWPVPATDEDRRRIIDLSRDIERESTPTSEGNVVADADWQLPRGQLFKRIQMDVLKNKTNHFQYTMEKNADGRCVFLTSSNRCALHERFGAESKPGMCQLFPYTFTETPDGYYASVSFASSGTLFNQGKPLAAQREHLSDRLELFKRLFPTLKLDWSQLQFFDGSPLRWAQYLLLERTILQSLKEMIDRSLYVQTNFTLPWYQLLESISTFLINKMPGGTDLDRRDLVPESLEGDLLILGFLLESYFPDDIFAGKDDEGPSIRNLMQGLLSAPDVVSMKIGNSIVPLAEICELELPTLDQQSENLIARYLYARVYSKLYFGAGMAHFSLIAGFHHLGILAALVRIKLKALVWQRQKQRHGQSESLGATNFDKVEFLEVAELVRNLERKLASFQHSSESATILQVLFESPARFKRLLALSI